MFNRHQKKRVTFQNSINSSSQGAFIRFKTWRIYRTTGRAVLRTATRIVVKPFQPALSVAIWGHLWRV